MARKPVSLVRRAAKGVAATTVMSIPMLVRWALQPAVPPPPLVVAENAQRRVGLRPERYPAVVRHAVWGAAHLGFGATLALAAELWPARARAPAAAQSFGLAAWTANYGLALPLLRIYPWPLRDDRLRASESLLSHFVYAAALRRASP